LDVNPIVWHVEHFEELDSTNNWLATQARAGAEEGRVVFADYQTAGRGRLDRRWESAPGASLLCSVLLRPALDADQLQLVVAAVALAARAALVRLCGVRPNLKWPNDLVVRDAKLAGLLAEVVVTSEGVAVVAGFGINLNESPHPGTTTNVRSEAGVTLSPRALLDIVLEEIEPRRARLDDDAGRATLRAEYEGALSTLGELVRVETATGSHVGVARGIDHRGRLVVDHGRSGTRAFASGDVVHLRKAQVGEE